MLFSTFICETKYNHIEILVNFEDNVNIPLCHAQTNKRTQPHTENFIGLTENGKISIEDRKFGSYVILPTEINTKTKIIQIIGSIT